MRGYFKRLYLSNTYIPFSLKRIEVFIITNIIIIIICPYFCIPLNYQQVSFHSIIKIINVLLDI